jgi:hypothetical protein
MVLQPGAFGRVRFEIEAGLRFRARFIDGFRGRDRFCPCDVQIVSAILTPNWRISPPV